MHSSIIATAATLLSVFSFATADPIVERQNVKVTQTLAYDQPSQSCVAGAHLIVGRASTEPQGVGLLSTVADGIMKMVPGSDVVSVVYPATLSDYPTSEQEGVVGMKMLVTDYVQKCPGHWIILMGYSQGAQIVGDTVIGSNNTNFSDQSTNPTGLGKQYLDQIAALIMMGDPGYAPGTPGHVGTAQKGGIFPRKNIDGFTQYGFNDKMQTYCDANDEYCASGDSLAVHVGYIAEYGSSAASYAASAFTKANGGGSGVAATGGASSGGASSAAATTAASGSSSKASSASSAARTSAAGGASSRASSAAGGATTARASTSGGSAVAAFLTSNAYTPTTTMFTGSFTQLANPAKPNDAAGSNVEKSVAGVVFGAAMFVMGVL